MNKQSFRKEISQLLIDKTVLLKRLNTIHPMFPQVLNNFKDRNLLKLLHTPYGLNHGAQRPRPPNARTTMNQKHLILDRQIQTLLNKRPKQILILIAQGFLQIRPSYPLHKEQLT